MVKDTWLRVKEGLSEKLPSHTISTWFDPINPIALENNEFVLEVPSQFFYDWIESHYRSNIDFVLKSLGLGDIKTKFIISAEIQKCSLGESKFMGTNQDCPATAAKAVSGAVATMTDKNPYNTSSNAVASSGSFVAGQVSVSSSGSTVTIKTCTKSGCASADQLTATVNVD